MEWKARDETLAAPGLGRTRSWRGHCSPGPGIGRVTQASRGQLDWVVEDARGTGSLRCFVRCPGLEGGGGVYAFLRFPMASVALQRLL